MRNSAETSTSSFNIEELPAVTISSQDKEHKEITGFNLIDARLKAVITESAMIIAHTKNTNT